MKSLSIAARALAIMAMLAILAGCGSSAPASASLAAEVSEGGSECPKTVLQTIGSVLMRVYHEGVESERTAAAKHLIETSKPLLEAVEAGDAAAVQAAEKALLATGHMSNLRVSSGGHVLAEVGEAAVAPLTGMLTGAGGRVLGTYVASVWSDAGFLDEARGVTEGVVALRVKERSVGGSLALPPGPLADEGTLAYEGLAYRYMSFPATAYPAGAMRIYLLRPVRSTAALCNHAATQTLVNTLHHVADMIYAAETGPRRSEQVRRVQRNSPLLNAVAARNPQATRLAIGPLLHEHIVRIRVSAGGQLLSDVGGPYVLAPVSAPLKLHGRTIGTVELSIQDDEGYLRLTKRLAALHVLMYMGSTLVKNSLGPEPGAVPASGPYTYRGRSFQVFTVDAESFPSGVLTIRVLVPIPYSSTS